MGTNVFLLIIQPLHYRSLSSKNTAVFIPTVHLVGGISHEVEAISRLLRFEHPQFVATSRRRAAQLSQDATARLQEAHLELLRAEKDKRVVAWVNDVAGVSVKSLGN